MPRLELEAPAALAAGETWRVVRRFAPERTGERLPPTATISDETRPVLRGFEPETLAYAPSKPIPADGRVRLSPPLTPGLQHDAVFLQTRVNLGERWVSLPGQLVDSVHERGKLRVHVDLELPEAAGGEAGVWVQALPPGGEAVHETPMFEVPERARLDFGAALLEPAWQAGPVAFSVEACVQPTGRCELVDRFTLDPADSSGRGVRRRSVGLDRHAGRRIALRFEARPRDAGGASLPVFVDPVLLAPGPSASGGPNLVLISLDTLRADHVGAYGYARDTTPFLDALASEGALFEQFVAAASSTRPAHMTMFTSLQPSVHGATENVGVRNLPVAATTLAELLQEAGIATGAVTENGAIDRSRGFARGFDFYVENRDAQRADLRTGQIEQGFETGLGWLDALREGGDRRFFLFLHTYQVHNPFTPPEAYAELFEGDGVSPARPGLRSDWNPLLYDREIRYADDRVRELVDGLRARGLQENTYVVVTSDHGEAFLEHGFVAHGASVHGEVLRVPWIVVGPGVPAGLRISAPVPMVDLMPTLLGLLGVPGTGMEMGRSQASALRGGASPSGEPRPIYSEAWAERAYRARGFDTVLQPTLALQRGDWKLIRSRTGPESHRYELYDLASDPSEEHDLHREQPEHLARLARMLDEYDAAVAGLHERLGGSRVGEDELIDPDTLEKLRALGYLD